MTPPPKSLLRLAIAIRSHVLRGGDRHPRRGLPGDRWQRCEQLARQICRAEQHGWQLAANQRRTDFRYALLSLQCDLAGLTDELGVAFSAPPAATLDEVYQDLLALTDEFVEFSFDTKEGWLAVTTEPIELDGHDLGPFEIRLDWGRLFAEHCYRIVAREPHPAASRSDIVHPHVADEALCEGQGRQAIRHALADARLLDFFTLVANVLRTYNAESPFVSLDAWHGQSCSDCGTFVTEEELYVCGRCGENLCDDCEVNCAGCGEAHCSGCLQSCRRCEETYCPACLRRCADCRVAVCSDCVDDQERCTQCHEEANETNDDPLESHPEIHTDGVGQVIVFP